MVESSLENKHTREGKKITTTSTITAKYTLLQSFFYAVFVNVFLASEFMWHIQIFELFMSVVSPRFSLSLWLDLFPEMFVVVVVVVWQPPIFELMSYNRDVSPDSQTFPILKTIMLFFLFFHFILLSAVILRYFLAAVYWDLREIYYTMNVN